MNRIEILGINLDQYFEYRDARNYESWIRYLLRDTPYAKTPVSIRGPKEQEVQKDGSWLKCIRITAPTYEIANEIAARVGFLEILPLEIVVEPAVATVISLAAERQKRLAHT